MRIRGWWLGPRIVSAHALGLFERREFACSAPPVARGTTSAAKSRRLGLCKSMAPPRDPDQSAEGCCLVNLLLAFAVENGSAKMGETLICAAGLAMIAYAKGPRLTQPPLGRVLLRSPPAGRQSHDVRRRWSKNEAPLAEGCDHSLLEEKWLCGQRAVCERLLLFAGPGVDGIAYLAE